MRVSNLCLSSYTLGSVSASVQLDTCPRTPSQISMSQHSLQYSNMNALSETHNDLQAWQKAHYGWKAQQDDWEGPHVCKSGYCVWSGGVFSGAGLSIVTTRLNSQRVQNVTAVSSDPYRSPHFDTFHIRHKGIGMVATQNIRRGERILAAKPAILVHRSLVDELDLEDQHYLLEEAVARLPRLRQQQFLAQAGDLGGHRIKDIMFTNSFQINLGGQDGQHFGNYPEVSRFNHDCRPK